MDILKTTIQLLQVWRIETYAIVKVFWWSCERMWAFRLHHINIDCISKGWIDQVNISYIKLCNPILRFVVECIKAIQHNTVNGVSHIQAKRFYIICLNHDNHIDTMTFGIAVLIIKTILCHSTYSNFTRNSYRLT